MFCNKCGKPLANGEACSCTKQEGGRSVQPTKSPISIKLATFKFTNLISMVLASLVLFSAFGSWFSMYLGDELIGKYSVLESRLGDVHVTFTVAKVFAIIAIVVYIVLMFTRIFEVKGLLGNVNVAIVADISFYAAYALAMFFGFMGCLAGDVDGAFVSSAVTMSFTWYVDLLLAFIGIANVFNSDVLKAVFTKSLMNEKR